MVDWERGGGGWGRRKERLEFEGDDEVNKCSSGGRSHGTSTRYPGPDGGGEREEERLRILPTSSTPPHRNKKMARMLLSICEPKKQQ